MAGAGAGESLEAWTGPTPAHVSALLWGHFFISYPGAASKVCPEPVTGQISKHAPTPVQRLQGSGTDETVMWDLRWDSLSKGRPPESAGLTVIRCQMCWSKQKGLVGWVEVRIVWRNCGSGSPLGGRRSVLRG